MKHLLMGIIVVAIASNAVVVQAADVFNMGGVRNANGSWTGLASIEFVTVGNPGNDGELSGQGAGGFGPNAICGGVNYIYQIDKFEITNAQYREFLNAKAKYGDPNNLYSIYMANSQGGGISRIGSGIVGDPYVYISRNGDPAWDNRPVTYVTDWDAFRFCNWLHNGQGDSDTENGAYINIGNKNTFQRQPDARYFIPSENEWYKAAYHKNDGVTCNYWHYPTASNDAPNPILLDPDPGNCANSWTHEGAMDIFTIGSPYYTSVVGDFENTPGPYGTFDQGGNVAEWTDNWMFYENRRICGGSWDNGSECMLAVNRIDVPSLDGGGLGFRIACVVPEPSSIMLILASALCLLAYAWRQRKRFF
jgi:formylglycine-generating enzyme